MYHLWVFFLGLVFVLVGVCFYFCGLQTEALVQLKGGRMSCLGCQEKEERSIHMATMLLQAHSISHLDYGITFLSKAGKCNSAQL